MSAAGCRYEVSYDPVEDLWVPANLVGLQAFDHHGSIISDLHNIRFAISREVFSLQTLHTRGFSSGHVAALKGCATHLGRGRIPVSAGSVVLDPTTNRFSGDLGREEHCRPSPSE